MVVAEAKTSELNGSCPLNGSAVLVVGGAPELGGRGLAPEVAVVKGSPLKKSPPPPPALTPPEPDDWREKGTHCNYYTSIIIFSREGECLAPKFDQWAIP